MTGAGKALLLVAAFAATALIGCGGEDSPAVVVPADTPHATVAAEGWRATLLGTGDEESELVLDPRVPADAREAARTLELETGASTGDPVSIEIEQGELPEPGAVISRRLAGPVPPGARAALAYFDDQHGAWIPVPSHLAPDRRTLRATVRHFSIWDDIVYGASSLLDTRVDAPHCQGPRPQWISDSGAVVFLDDKNAPLRWCAGHDPKRPDVLVVKVAMNRGYGVRLVPEVRPEWMYDGLFQTGPEGFLSDAAVRLSRAFGGRSPRPGETVLLGGEEVHYGFTESRVRGLDGPVLVRARREKPEALVGFTYTALAKLAGDEGRVGRQVAAVVALVGVAQCEFEIGKPLSRADFVGAAKGAYDCLVEHGDDVSRATAAAIASALPKADPKVAGRIAGKLGGKLWQLWAAGELFGAGTLGADTQLASNAFELHAFPDPLPAPNLSRAQLNPTGFGPIRIGMTEAEVRSLRIPLRITHSTFCDSWEVPGAPDVQMVMTHDTGRLASAWIYETSPNAPRGVQIGDTLGELEAVYGGALEVISGGSLGRDFYRVYGPGGTTTLQFTVDRATATVDYIEVAAPGDFYYPDGNELCA